MPISFLRSRYRISTSRDIDTTRDFEESQTDSRSLSSSESSLMFFPILVWSSPIPLFIEGPERQRYFRPPILSYPILSYPIESYPILSYRVLSCPIQSYHTCYDLGKILFRTRPPIGDHIIRRSHLMSLSCPIKSALRSRHHHDDGGLVAS